MIKRILNLKSLLQDIYQQIYNIKKSCDEIKDKLSDKQSDTYVEINKLHIKVKNHWFWDQFKSNGWEPQTYLIMSKYLSNKGSYIDIGTWVGPTVFYSSEIGVKNIYGIEANPITFQHLSETVSMNKVLNSVKLYNLCISDQDEGIVSFGGRNGRDTSSASSIRGNDWKVESSTITGFIERNNINNLDLIKIDIEGAEELIIDDLFKLSKIPGLVIILSLHPPFWSDKVLVANCLLKSFELYDIFSMDEGILQYKVLDERMKSNIEYPNWGTQHGNFFEILMMSKHDKN